VHIASIIKMILSVGTLVALIRTVSSFPCMSGLYPQPQYPFRFKSFILYFPCFPLWGPGQGLILSIFVCLTGIPISPGFQLCLVLFHRFFKCFSTFSFFCFISLLLFSCPHSTYLIFCLLHVSITLIQPSCGPPNFLLAQCVLCSVCPHLHPDPSATGPAKFQPDPACSYLPQVFQCITHSSS
jgi:hypothetical protein